MSEVSSRRTPVDNALELSEKFLDQQVQVYTTSIYTTVHIEKKVRAVVDFLEARGIDHKLIDMCYDLEARPRMIELLPEEMKEDSANVLAPQVFCGDFDYCGNFDDFSLAKEMDLIYTFFKVTPPEGSAEYIAAFPEPSIVSEPEPVPSEPEEQQIEEQQIEEQQIEEQKVYDPEVSMGQGNIEDTEMFQAVMQEQSSAPQEQEGEKDVIELSVSASGHGESDQELSDEEEEDEEEEASESEEESETGSVIQRSEVNVDEVGSDAESVATVSEA